MAIGDQNVRGFRLGPSNAGSNPIGPTGPAGPPGPPGPPGPSGAAAGCFNIGHLAGEVTPYADGVVTSECVRCGERMQFQMPAGGNLRLEAEGLVTHFLSASKAIDPDPDLRDRIQMMSAKLRLDVSALREAVKVLDMIDAGLARRVLEDR